MTAIVIPFPNTAPGSTAEAVRAGCVALTPHPQPAAHPARKDDNDEWKWNR